MHNPEPVDVVHVDLVVDPHRVDDHELTVQMREPVEVAVTAKIKALALTALLQLVALATHVDVPRIDQGAPTAVANKGLQSEGNARAALGLLRHGHGLGLGYRWKCGLDQPWTRTDSFP